MMSAVGITLTCHWILLIMVQAGERLTIPDNCPIKLSNQIKSCWYDGTFPMITKTYLLDPKNRPEFFELIFKIEEMMNVSNLSNDGIITIEELKPKKQVQKKDLPKETNIWYHHTRYKFYQSRNNEEGILTFSGKILKYVRPGFKLEIKQETVQQVFHTHMGGDASNSWTLVEYVEGQETKQAFFAKSTGGVTAQLLGGGKELFNTVTSWFEDQ